MVAKDAAAIRRVYTLLNLPIPDGATIERLVNDPRSITDIRNALLWAIANADPNDDITNISDALTQILDLSFSEAGIENATTATETEAQRFSRITESILSGERTLGEVLTTIADFSTGGGGGDILDPDKGVTDIPPVDIGNSTIPQGGSLIRVKNPEGSDAAFLYYIVYDWRGVKLAYEVGDTARFQELFGSTDNFESFETFSQTRFDSESYVLAGSIDEELGATESIGSRIERDIRALGLEDLPPWLAGSSEALALVAEASADEWSAGRLWQSLSDTQAFNDRFGDVIDRYLQGGTTISQAVAQIQADEQSMKSRLLYLAPEASLTTESIHDMLSQGWTPDSAARVLEQADILSGGATLAQANEILATVGLPSLDDVGFINALNGHGPPEVVEALNTIAAGQALAEAGLDDVDLDLLMDIVDTSDRLLTVDSFQQLTQQLSFNLARFGTEVDTQKLGISRDDIIAGIFGEESPSGKTPGQTLNLLAKFERERTAAARGFDASTAAIDTRGRLRVAGIRGL